MSRSTKGTISDTGELAPSQRAFADTHPAYPSVDLTGTTIDRYRVLGRIGAGGMGVVYAAFDPALDRKVALKMLAQVTVETHAAMEARARLEARLRREAQALAKLDHPNVIGVFDVGFTEDNVFVTMQLVDGTTLDDYLRTAKPSPRKVLELFVAAGRGLAAAHAAGLVHRDVKPSNILVDRTGHAYVGDFGLARGVDEIEPASSMPRGLLYEQMTRMGTLLGTPRYMSPEQLGGEAATRAIRISSASACRRGRRCSACIRSSSNRGRSKARSPRWRPTRFASRRRGPCRHVWSAHSFAGCAVMPPRAGRRWSSWSTRSRRDRRPGGCTAAVRSSGWRSPSGSPRW